VAPKIAATDHAAAVLNLIAPLGLLDAEGLATAVPELRAGAFPVVLFGATLPTV
jgi:hypothetical protein